MRKEAKKLVLCEKLITFYKSSVTVNDVMSGQVLEHEGKTIYNAGIKEDIAIGQREANLDTARRLRAMGMNDNDIHRATHVSFDDLELL